MWRQHNALHSTTERKSDSVRLILFAQGLSAAILPQMEQRINHACGHTQDHHLTGFSSQQHRKARWLATTSCRTCFLAQKQAEQTDAATRDGAAIIHLELPILIGSDRQVGWASSIRAQRLAACIAAGVADEKVAGLSAVVDAKWWIDHRDVTNAALLTAAQHHESAPVMAMPAAA